MEQKYRKKTTANFVTNWEKKTCWGVFLTPLIVCEGIHRTCTMRVMNRRIHRANVSNRWYIRKICEWLWLDPRWISLPSNGQSRKWNNFHEKKNWISIGLFKSRVCLTLNIVPQHHNVLCDWHVSIFHVNCELPKPMIFRYPKQMPMSWFHWVPKRVFVVC